MYESLLTHPGRLFDEFDRLRRELDTSLGGFGFPTSIRAVARGSYPAVNIGSTPKSIEVYAFAPGLDREKLEVSVDKGLLTIAGERADGGAPEREQVRNFYAKERFVGRFRRVMSLPEDADPAKVEAKYTDGLLRITVGRREQAQPQRITVQ